MDRSNIAERMKTYEAVPKNFLMTRQPVIIRLDGKAFHSFTKGFERPFDLILIQTMQHTMEHLCKNIQGCVFGYTQSDEISLVLVDYQNLFTNAWFNNNVQKITSIASSMATLYFNKYFAQTVDNFIKFSDDDLSSEHYVKLINTYQKRIASGAMFDARCFNLSKEEVANYIYWRQNDAIRNSIQMVGQSNFSRRQLHGVSCNQIKSMLRDEKNIFWDDYPKYMQHGSSCYKIDGKWSIDDNMPVILGYDREYVERHIFL